MFQYILRRVLLVFPTLVLVVAIVFISMRILPTDIADIIVDSAGVGGAAYTKQAIREQLNLDKPLVVQLGLYFGGIVRGDMGVSAYDRKPVIKKVFDAFPITLELAILSMFVSAVIALFVGILCATYQDTVFDYILRVLSILSFSAPVFWVGTIVVIFPAIWWNYFPPLFYVPFQQNPIENVRQFVVPSLVLGLSLSGSVARMVRSSMLEVLRQDYIRTARAKGLSEWVVLGRHALRNSFIPVVTFWGLQLAVMLGGAVIVESIFALPGMGSLTIVSVLTKDYPVIQGCVLVFATIVAVVNLGVDLLYGILDPRLRYG